MPTPFAILWPVFALAAWTGCVLVLVGARRVTAGRQGLVHPREYALGESARVPDHVRLPNRNYMNLLELPVLFYLACVLAQVTGLASPTLVVLAWAYVGLRVAHSLVHLTCNHVMHRFAAFGASNGVLIAMWLLLGHALAGAA